MSRGGRVEREQVMDEAAVQALHTRCDVLARELTRLDARLDGVVSRLQDVEDGDAKKQQQIEAYVRAFTPRDQVELVRADPRAWKLDEHGNPETFPWSCSACGSVHWYKPSETVESSKELAQACKDAMRAGTDNGAHAWWVALAKQVRRGVHDEIKLQLQAVIPSLKKD
jgi:hypothetical protein